MVLLSSCRIPRVLHYSGYSPPILYFVYETFTLCRPVFQSAFDYRLSYLMRVRNPFRVLLLLRFRLFPFRSPLLRKSIVFFLFLRVLRCFSSPGSPPITIHSSWVTQLLFCVSFLIRISTDQYSFATPRSFSQLVTSFFGAWCQGIRPTLLLA